MDIVEVTVNTVIRTRNGGPDTRALVLSRKTRDWTITGVSARKHHTARGNHSTGYPEKSRRSDGVVSWGPAMELRDGRVIGRVEVNCS